MTVELGSEQVQFLIRHLKNAIRHLETYGAQLPTRKERTKRFRALLAKLETEQ